MSPQHGLHGTPWAVEFSVPYGHQELSRRQVRCASHVALQLGESEKVAIGPTDEGLVSIDRLHMKVPLVEMD
jgi:hypothetical protein